MIAADPKVDIAVIQLASAPKTPLKPLVVSGGSPGPGTDIAVLGYPLGDRLGGSLKLTKGSISAPPDKELGGMYLLDCKVNHGNSGGPMCDMRGMVVGLVSAKSRLGTKDEDSYGLALPPNVIAKFLSAHVPSFKIGPAIAGKKYSDWNDVYSLVNASTVMILKRPE